MHDFHFVSEMFFIFLKNDQTMEDLDKLTIDYLSSWFATGYSLILES